MCVLLITRLLRGVGRWARKPVNHTSWVAVVTPTDRPKSVRNCCLMELFCGVVCVVTLPLWHFCWYRGFCHRTGSDLLLFVYLSCLSDFSETFGMRPILIDSIANPLLNLSHYITSSEWHACLLKKRSAFMHIVTRLISDVHFHITGPNLTFSTYHYRHCDASMSQKTADYFPSGGVIRNVAR